MGKSFKVISYDLFDEYGFENCNIILSESLLCTSVTTLKDEKKNQKKPTISKN